MNPGSRSNYRGAADTALTDLAAPVYGLILEETFGLRVLNRKQTLHFLESRRSRDGLYRSKSRVRGRRNPAHLLLYNTLQALLGLRIIGVNKVPRVGLAASTRAVMSMFRRGAYKHFPPYALDFFSQYFGVVNKPYPPAAQAITNRYLSAYRDGEVYGHVASTFHFVRHARLTGIPINVAPEILAKTLTLQRRDGSFNCMPDPAWDRHATFDGCFIVRQLGSKLGWKRSCNRAMQAAGRYALSCRNPDGGFGHFPGKTSDIDAVYFHAGTLVMAGMLPHERIPANLRRVLGWGHVFTG